MADAFFCLDIGESFIKVADVKKEGSLIDFTNLGYIANNPSFYPSGTEKGIDEVAGYIGKLIDSLKIVKKNVNVIIPDTYTFSQVMEMPRLNEKELISAIKYQADQFIPMPIEEASIDIEILHENERTNKLSVLMVAASKNLLNKIQRTVELAGLIPASIENELSATSRFVSEIYKNPNNPPEGIVILNINTNSSSLYFFEPTQLLISLNHNFSVGSNLFIKELQINLNLDKTKATEALKKISDGDKTSFSADSVIAPAVREINLEIGNFINSVSQKFQVKISKIFLTNEAFNLPFLAKAIETNFSIPSFLMNPYPMAKKSTLVESFKNDLSLFTSTIGGNLR